MYYKIIAPFRNLSYPVIATGAAILFSFLLAWFTFQHHIPELIPYTPIHFFGIVWLLFLIILFTLLFKYLLSKSAYTIIELTFHGIFVIVVSEIIFQGIRLRTYEGYAVIELLGIFYRAIILSSLLGGAIAFLIAKKLKTGKVAKEVAYFMLALIALGWLIDLLSFSS